MSEPKPVCQICDEKFNKSKNIKISCPYCDFDACRKCCETYMLSEPMPKCMNTSCGKIWTRKFITNAFTKVFITKSLKAHREQILFDQERALFPATQIVIERQISFEKYTRSIREIDEHIQRLRREKIHLATDYQNNRVDEPTTRRQFVRACPESECRGFLSSQWKCGLCDKWTCPDCHIVKGLTRDVEHTCNPDDVATAQLLANDTKPCPKCATGIFKIDGCDQMWCTQCHTAFSWRSGQIENRIHNPHYYEWLRRNGDEETLQNLNQQAQQHNQCNNEDAGHALSNNIMRRLRSILPDSNERKELCMKTSNIISSIVHLREVIMDRYATDNNVLNNEQLRIYYMRNIIDEETFKTRLQRDNKKHEKKREIAEILEMFIVTSSDIMRRYHSFIRRCENPDAIYENTILGEIDQIVEYANECLDIICKTYDSVRLKIILRGTIEYNSYHNNILCTVFPKREEAPIAGNINTNNNTNNIVVV